MPRVAPISGNFGYVGNFGKVGNVQVWQNLPASGIPSTRTRRSATQAVLKDKHSQVQQ